MILVLGCGYETETCGKWGFVQCGCGPRGPDIRTGYEPVERWGDAAGAEWNRRP